MAYLQLYPLDEGLRRDRPTLEAKWTEMTNFIIWDGLLRMRPGFSCASVYGYDTTYPNVERGTPVAIMEIDNPGSSATGRQGYAWIRETLRPDSDADIVSGWSGAYTDIDDSGNPDGNIMSSSTVGSQINLGFGNLSGTIDTISGLILRGRVRKTAADQVTLKFYYRSGTTNYSVGSVPLYVSENAEGTGWQTFAIQIPDNPARSIFSNRKWTTSTVNSVQIVMELEEALTAESIPIHMAADGIETDFTDFTNGDTATYTDFDTDPKDSVWDTDVFDACSGQPLTLNISNAINSTYGTTGEKQSWTYESIDRTLSSITSLEFRFAAITEKDWSPAGVVAHQFDEWTANVFFYPTAGDDSTSHNLGTISRSDADRGGFIGLTSTTNPETSAAWTTANVAAGEFGIEVVSGRIGIDMHWLKVNAVVSAGGAQVDMIALDVCGADADATYNDGVIGMSKVFSTNFAHIKVSDDYNWTLADKTNSVAVTSPPHLPLDHAVLYGQVYLVNGIDATRRYPDASDDFEALTTNNADGSTKITGRTVMGFADRIFYGWVTDNTTVTPERVAYSKWQDGGTHNDPSAGDFDLLDTPGGIVKLAVLTEDLAAAYKRTGVYVLRRTGDSVAPIVRDVIDHFTGCLAPMTVKPVVDTNGNTVHLFLGFNMADGYNVFAFDGSQVVPVGDPIKPILRFDIQHESLRSAFAEVDPQTGNYFLFLPSSDDMMAEGGVCYNIRALKWTEFTLPFIASCGGMWHMSNDPPSIFGTPTMIVGSADSYIRKANWSIAYDTGAPGAQDLLASRQYHQDDDNEMGVAKEPITATLETGDLSLAGQDNPRQSVLNRVHLSYYDYGPTQVKITASGDGGATWETEATHVIGSAGNKGRFAKLRFDQLDFDSPITAWRHRVRLKFEPISDGQDYIPSFPVLGEIILDFEPVEAAA